MRKATIAAIVFVAVILLAILLPRLVPLDALKPRIVALLEEKTGRKVSFSRISLSLIPGIGLRIADLSVSGDPGHPGETLLSVPETEIRIAYLPLLSGRAEFGKLLLRRPEILFRRFRDGTHSVTPMARQMARAEGQAPSREEKVSVALKALSVEEAKVTLILTGEDGRETRWRIDPLTLRIDGIGGRRNDFEIETRIDGTVRGEIEFSGTAVREGAVAGKATVHVDGKGKAFGQPVTVKGTLAETAGPTEMDLLVTLPKIDMEKIPGIFASPPAMLSEASLKGSATLAVKASGNPERLGLGAEFRFLPLVATAEASLVSSTGAREWSVSARIASLADFAKSGAGGLARWAPAGRLTVSASGKRTAASAKDVWAAALDLGDVGVSLPEPKMRLEGMNGQVGLSERTVDFRSLSGSLNGQRFTLHGPVALGAPPGGTVSLRMAYLDLDALFPPSAPGEPAKKQEPASAAGKGEEAKGISARGTLRIDVGKGRGLEFRELAGTGRYEGGTLFLDSLRARLYGGEATISGRIRLAGQNPDFRVKAAVKDVAAGEVLSRKTSLKDFFSGKATVSADLGGGARDFPDFTRTAAGSGSFRVADGRIKGVDLLSAAAERSGLTSVLPLAPSAGRTAETSFSDLSCDFRIEGGKIRTDSLRIISEKMGLTGSATLGFDRAFDFRGTLVLSKELSERVRGSAGRFLTGPSGRVEVPLAISGAVTSPDVAVDREALARGVADKALKRLKGSVPGSPPASGEDAGKKPARTEPEKALEGLIDKLLPRKK